MADLEVSGAKEAAFFLIAGTIAGVILALYLWIMRKAGV